jgi:hypothetical protein
VSPGHHADCADVEPGDLTPAEAPRWVEEDKKAGWPKPCLYSDWWEWTQELAPVLKKAGIALSSVFKWVASYVGHPQLIAGFDADQYDDHCLGLNLDCSLVLRSFLAIAHPPLKTLSKPRAKSASERTLGELLGRRSQRDPEGHNCQNPPYKHAYPSARWDHACGVWADQLRKLRTKQP